MGTNVPLLFMKHLVWTSEYKDQLVFTEHGFEIKAPRDITIPYEIPFTVDTGVTLKSRVPYLFLLESAIPLLIWKSFRILEANKSMEIQLDYYNGRHYPNLTVKEGDTLARIVMIETNYTNLFRMNHKEVERY